MDFQAYLNQLFLSSTHMNLYDYNTQQIRTPERDEKHTNKKLKKLQVITAFLIHV